MIHFHPKIGLVHTDIATWSYDRFRQSIVIAFDISLHGWMESTSARGVMDDFGNLVKVA